MGKVYVTGRQNVKGHEYVKSWIWNVHVSDKVSSLERLLGSPNSIPNFPERARQRDYFHSFSLFYVFQKAVAEESVLFFRSVSKAPFEELSKMKKEHLVLNGRNGFN